MALSNKARNYIQKHFPGKSSEKIAEELKLDPAEVKAYTDQLSADEIPAPRRKVFFLFMLAIPVLFFIVLEVALRIGDYRGNLDLFIYPEVFGGKYGVVNPDYTARYFFATTTIPSPPNDVFLIDKPENGFRVFALGGSSANGYPYGYNATFSRVVRDVLQDAMPDRHVEVVNIATAAINTFTLYDTIDEVIAQKPDAIMIYSGHNEYYGALGVGSSETLGAFPGFIRTYLKLQRFKTFLLIRDGLVKMASLFGPSGSEVRDSGTLMQRMVGQQQITLDSDLYEMGKVQYESNLNAIIKKLDRRGIPVFLGSLTSNLKDHEPFISTATEDHPPADEIFQRAEREYRAQDYERALSSFIYARDLDALRFRAPTSFGDIIRGVSESYETVHYVPVKEAFLDSSEHGLIGFNLMLEHLHPNYTGYHLMGMTFAETMMNALAGTQNIRRDLVQSPEDYMNRMQLTEFDKRVGDHRVKLLVNSWPFVEQRRPGSYPDNYRPFSLADSMAYEVVNSRNMRWDKGKVELAELYQNTRRFDKAIAEYEGLMRDQPFNDSPFLFAARIHLRTDNFTEAKPYLEAAFQIEESHFAARMLGAIEVDFGNLDRGIELLEQARSMEPEDPQTLFNLSGAYGLTRDFEKADEILQILEQVNPGYPGAREWRRQLDGHLRRARSN